eukprot:TRINITY_DN526_c0_g1_i1.p1 TRINITY_DN526_c0_g1~~TRINITY_DN526_c0_g1_i1.p1  ORF type:complete len:339 (-),score=121.40 TRINITY_DN526_c0_g1_i1:17-1033(-)
MGKTDKRTKIIIKNIPPLLSEENFLKSISNWETKYDYFAYFMGNKKNKKIIYSYAYINFYNIQTVYEFHNSFNGHLFVDEKGIEYSVRVEFSPNQKVPKKNLKPNVKENTYELDADYKRFCVEQNKPKIMKPSAEIQYETRLALEEELKKETGSLPPKISPLLLELNNKKKQNSKNNAANKRRKQKEKQRRQQRQQQKKKFQQKGGKNKTQWKNNKNDHNEVEVGQIKIQKRPANEKTNNNNKNNDNNNNNNNSNSNSNQNKSKNNNRNRNRNRNYKNKSNNNNNSDDNNSDNNNNGNGNNKKRNNRNNRGRYKKSNRGRGGYKGNNNNNNNKTKTEG